MASIGKWYTFTEYYDEDGIQISKKQALKHYIITGKTIKKETNGAVGKITIWYTCEKDKQYKLF